MTTGRPPDWHNHKPGYPGTRVPGYPGLEAVKPVNPGLKNTVRVCIPDPNVRLNSPSHRAVELNAKAHDSIVKRTRRSLRYVNFRFNDKICLKCTYDIRNDSPESEHDVTSLSPVADAAAVVTVRTSDLVCGISIRVDLTSSTVARISRPAIAAAATSAACDVRVSRQSDIFSRFLGCDNVADLTFLPARQLF